MKSSKFFKYYLLMFLAIAFPLFCDPLTFNIFGKNNGRGLERDRTILTEALVSFGHTVRGYDFYDMDVLDADINIFLEVPVKEQFSKARLNWFIPNPEWYEFGYDLIYEFDLIVCRTHEVERIFRQLGAPVFYTGFTSVDCYEKGSRKNYHEFLHVAGKSDVKGSNTLIEVWYDNDQFPHLTLLWRLKPYMKDKANFEWVSHSIPEQELRSLQNSCGIHLCPSTTEGFGHTLMEGLSAGAIVVTTDAPPMNEMVTDSRFLVRSYFSKPLKLSTNYLVYASDLSRKIDQILKLPLDELKKVSINNRKRYKFLKQQFLTNFKQLVDLTENNLAQSPPSKELVKK